ncbi:MAG: hypothetical protein IPL49_18985 [Saprospirales bacterium]|nr:hypothetical protein [Saprospirales bacterium]MBK8492909.1 hypothetical protein [Saprospirales bacterium]
MKKIIIIVIHAFLCPSAWGQVDDYQILRAVISIDSFGLLQEVSNSNGDLIYIQNYAFPPFGNNLKENFPNLHLKTVDSFQYYGMSKKEKRSCPVVFIDRFWIESNIVTYNVKGARYEVTRKNRDCFFVFSDFLISYKFDCSRNKWELYVIKIKALD